MQKLINVFAIASFAVSGAVVGSGLYIYINRASIIDGIKSQALEAILGDSGLPGGMGGTDALPIGSPDLVPPAGQAAAPSTSGLPTF